MNIRYILNDEKVLNIFGNKGIGGISQNEELREEEEIVNLKQDN